MLQPTLASSIKGKQLRQQKQALQSKRDFDVGEKVWLRDYRGTDKWVDETVIENQELSITTFKAERELYTDMLIN